MREQYRRRDEPDEAPDDRATLHDLLTRVAQSRHLVEGVHPGYRALGDSC